MTKFLIVASLLSLFAIGCSREEGTRPLSNDQGIEREEDYRQRDLNEGPMNESDAAVEEDSSIVE